MSAGTQNDLVELRARVILISSYVQFLLLESATMPQYFDLIEPHLKKLQMQVRELDGLTNQLCEAVWPVNERRLTKMP